MLKDIRHTLERVREHANQGIAEEQGVILPIKLQREECSGINLSPNMSSEYEILPSLLKETVKTTLGTTMKRAIDPLMGIYESILTQGNESSAVLDFVKDVTKALRAEHFETPRLACLLSPWDF